MIKVQNLSRTFGDFKAVDDISFEVAAGEIFAFLVAPVSRIQIMLGRTCGSATTAMLQGTMVAVVCVIAGFRPVSLAQIPLGFGFLALTAIVFTATGTAIGSTLKDMQGFQMVMNFLVLPLFFLSGALYPLDNLPKALVALTHIDPMTYGVDGMRAALINRSHFGASLDALVLLGFGVALTLVGAWRFSKIEV
jgi:ABC-2 type transport system permease protein